MIRLGLTGSIGMGKSTTADMFRDAGISVHDADATVHQLYVKGGAAVALIETAFPGVAGEDGVDRSRLSKAVLGNSDAMKRLEAIVHPLVHQQEQSFLAAAQERGEKLVVLDIPLLFETNAKARVDRILVVTAPAEVQRARVLARDGMSPEKFEAILARQVPDAEKREKADFLIDTSLGVDHARASVREIIDQLLIEADKTVD